MENINNLLKANYFSKAFDVLKQIYPLSRDLISDGYDIALNSICESYLDIYLDSFPSGEKHFTWTIPQKWRLNSAYISDVNGNIIYDCKDSPLFVASYSHSFDGVVSKDELLKHINISQKSTEYIPFGYCYYKDEWAFNLSKSSLEKLVENKYHVYIDSSFEDGFLKVGNWRINGEVEDTIVIATHLDHPFQANDGLSGVITGLALFDMLSRIKTHYSYHLIILPETIGSIAWLSKNKNKIKSFIGGFFIEMAGTDLPISVQTSYNGNTIFDKQIKNIFSMIAPNVKFYSYRSLPGNDERQFNAPGIRIPMLSLCRCLPPGHNDFPFLQYHTLDDNLDIISFEKLKESVEVLYHSLLMYDTNYRPINNFAGEIFLRGLKYKSTISYSINYIDQLKIIDMIDGENDILDISLATNISFYDIYNFLEVLAYNGLIKNKCYRE